MDFITDMIDEIIDKIILEDKKRRFKSIINKPQMDYYQRNKEILNKKRRDKYNSDKLKN